LRSGGANCPRAKDQRHSRSPAIGFWRSLARVVSLVFPFTFHPAVSTAPEPCRRWRQHPVPLRGPPQPGSPSQGHQTSAGSPRAERGRSDPAEGASPGTKTRTHAEVSASSHVDAGLHAPGRRSVPAALPDDVAEDAVAPLASAFRTVSACRPRARTPWYR
jgi:hypothetical protein